MLQRTNINSKGFSLIELIVAIAIFSGLSILSVQTLWDTLSTRAKQYSIENSTSAVRPILATLEQAITSASQSNIISATEIQITGVTCRTIKLVSPSIVSASTTTANCTPPISGFVALTPSNVMVTTFSLFPTSGVNPKIISITIGGTYKDSLGSHTFFVTTSAVPRVTL